MSKNLIGRIAQWLANEIIVKGLANNKAFQEFALKTHHKTQELAKQSAEATRKLAESEVANQVRQESKLYAEQMSRGLAEIGNKISLFSQALKQELKKASEEIKRSLDQQQQIKK